MKAGFRTNNIDPNARHCMASAVTGFMRTFGMDEPMGCYDDIEATDAFVLWGSNMAEMHPILWTRVTDRKLSVPKTKVAVLSTFEHRSFDLADQQLIFTPQSDLAIMNYIANYIIKTNRVNRDFVTKHTVFKEGNTDIGYGLRPDHPLQKAAKNAERCDRLEADGLRRVRQIRLEVRRRLRDEALGHPEGEARPARRALRRSEDQGGLVLDDGFQPAHARHVGQQHGLQPAPADRQDLDARQQPVLADRAAVRVRHGARSGHVLAPAAGGHARRQSGTPQARRGNLEAAARHDSREARLPRGAAEPHAEGRQAQRVLGDGQQQHAGRRQLDAGDVARVSESGQFHRRVGCVSDRDGGGRRPDPAERNVGRKRGRLWQRGTPHPVLASARAAARRRALGPVAARRVFEALQGRGSLAARADRASSPN